MTNNNPIWAKLTPLNPEKETILFYTKPNEPNQYNTNPEWKIYQKTIGGQIWIVNLSTTYIRVEDTWLEAGDAKQLLGWEAIAFSQEKINSDAHYDYIFSALNSNFNSDNELKRHRNLNQEPKAKLQSCAICQKAITNRTTLDPCLQNFCDGCVSGHLKRSAFLCQKEIKSVNNNPLLQKILQSTLQTSQTNRKPLRDITNQLLNEKIKKESETNYTRDEKGRVLYEDGNTYKGGWNNNKRQGKGVLTLKNGNIYEGTWVNDNLQKGKIVYPDRKIYEGEIKDLKRHGKGTLTLGKKMLYEGDWVDDLKHGKGKEYGWTYYDGNWEYGVKCGYGEMVFPFPDKRVYKGDWKNDKQHGIGTCVWNWGDVYEGEWEDGKRSGKGTQRYPNGIEYSGSWVRGYWKEGTRKKDGTKYTGTWYKNSLRQDILIEYANGDRYFGRIDSRSSYKKQGEGVMIYKNGDTYEGKWKDDQHHGQGRYAWKEDKHSYNGMWADGKMHGKGTMFYADGKRIYGIWENGEQKQ